MVSNSAELSLEARNERQAGIRARFCELKDFLEAGLIGGETLVERLLIGLLADGHLLIEGAPGLAKTRAVKLLAEGLSVPLARIQCTPDLMPADLTGTAVWRQDRGVFEFVAGPIFHSLILVDEINRAPPKVQSALLEAMAERQVTAAGVTRPLPDPFMVVATQNPIEHEGTFPLPEAQLDRFMIHAEVKLPDAATERKILDLVEHEATEGTPTAAHHLGAAEIAAARAAATGVYLSPAVKDYIVRLVTALRSEEVAPRIRRKVEHPPSPRGTIALAKGAKARAFLAGRDHVTPQDVAELAVDTLAHRTILTWRALADGDTTRSVILELLDEITPV
ncbi:ATPase associated with various cellular activities AAA_3 [Methylocella silvestris BL2]|uniref:ATPase associated with various cellular activities AAA_3 n=1 Tax=Methylocella silvestris (strain DSM 15510 / CIP 108128 / LMG 27833 / NCIMB 13906 / BL2) TaxID=395965 RepID=B8EKN1_METSB|nr:ATPase associated with various cellular activities AAA_3 [Methylocella silvestris BL2]